MQSVGGNLVSSLNSPINFKESYMKDVLTSCINEKLVEGVRTVSKYFLSWLKYLYNLYYEKKLWNRIS